MSSFKMTKAQFLQALEDPNRPRSDLVVSWKLLSNEEQRSCFHAALNESLQQMEAPLLQAVWEERSRLSLSVPKQLFSIYLHAVESRRLSQDPPLRQFTEATMRENEMASHLAYHLSSIHQAFTPKMSLMIVRMGIPFLCQPHFHKEAFRAAWSQASTDEQFEALEAGVRSIRAERSLYGKHDFNGFLLEAWEAASLSTSQRVELLERFLPSTLEQSAAHAVEEMEGVLQAAQVKCLATTLGQWSPRQNWLEFLAQCYPAPAEDSNCPPDNTQATALLAQMLGYNETTALPDGGLKDLLGKLQWPSRWEQSLGQTMALQACAGKFPTQDHLLVESIFLLARMTELGLVAPEQQADCCEAFVHHLTQPLEQVVGGFDEEERLYIRDFRVACQHVALDKALSSPSPTMPRARF